MSAPAKLNYKMYQGSTFSEVLRWESSKKIYKDITNISKAAPCTITANTTGLPNGWRIKVTNVGGMKEINDTENYVNAEVVNGTTISLNSINSLAYTTYTSGGIVEFNEPINLSIYSARMQIREKLTSDTVIHELTTANGGILLDNTLKTITLYIPATTTQNFTFTKAVYSLELVDSTNSSVTTLLTGSITLYNEVTR
jgi:hypothetical protein